MAGAAPSMVHVGPRGSKHGDLWAELTRSMEDLEMSQAIAFAGERPASRGGKGGRLERVGDGYTMINRRVGAWLRLLMLMVALGLA